MPGSSSINRASDASSPASASQKLLPEGYTFIDPWTMISERAVKLYTELEEKAYNRDPDAHGMYIYNDFYSYAIVDLVDKTLSALHSKIAKKQWEDAYVQLEALVIFLDGPGMVWPMIDDREHTEQTNRAYGVCVVAVLRGLKSEGKLSPSHLPSLETILREITKWGDAISKLDKWSSVYRFVTKAMGKRFFSEKSDAETQFQKQMMEEWVSRLEPDDKATMERKIRKRKEEDEADDSWTEDPKYRNRIIGYVRKKDRKPWWHNASTDDWERGFDDDEDKDSVSFELGKVWKEYKDFLRDNPNVPELREDFMPKRYCKWDLTKWSGRMKEPFLLHASDESDEGY